MLEGTWNVPSSSSDSEHTEGDIAIDKAEIDVVAHRGAHVSLTIHDRLDLDKLQQVPLPLLASPQKAERIYPV